MPAESGAHSPRRQGAVRPRALERPRRHGLSRRRDPGNIWRRRCRTSRTLRDCGRDGPRAGAGGSLNGVKKPVPDGAIADFAIVAARTGSSRRETDISLFLVDMKAEGVEAKSLTNVDPSRGQAEL